MAKCFETGSKAGVRGAVGRVALIVRLLLDRFLDELALLGIASRPAFVREPEGDGCAERFIRTLKPQLLWVQAFDTVEELRLALLVFYVRHKRDWLIEPNGP